jgi:hypothetical protein
MLARPPGEHRGCGDCWIDALAQAEHRKPQPASLSSMVQGVGRGGWLQTEARFLAE